MLGYFDLRKGIEFVMDGDPYEVLEFQQTSKAQDMVAARTRIKNLISGKIIEKTFHKSDTFEEAELQKIDAKFVYASRGKYVFAKADNPAERFELTEELIGDGTKFLKPNLVVTGIKFNDKIINILLPIKVSYKVIEAAPGIRGDRAQGGTKTVKIETGAEIQAPLFVEQDEIIELNTETGEYVRRIDPK